MGVRIYPQEGSLANVKTESLGPVSREWKCHFTVSMCTLTDLTECWVWAKCRPQMTVPYFCTDPMRERMLAAPSYKVDSQGSERLRSLAKTTQLV